MIIYFFKDRSKERVNFGQLIDEYFDKLENTVITSHSSRGSGLRAHCPRLRC